MSPRCGRSARRLRTGLQLIAIAALAGLLLPLAVRLPLPEPLRWPMDLAVHWQWLYAVAFTVACAGCGWWKRRWLLLLPAAILPWWTASDVLQTNASTHPHLRVVFANVNVANHDPSRLLAWLSQHPADVLAIAELSPAFASALERDAPAHLRYRSLHPQTTPWGLALLSQQPLRDVRLLQGRDGVPRLEAWLEVDGVPARIVVAHPKPPLSPAMLTDRDRLIESIAKGAGQAAVVVAGDFNATPWSQALTRAGSQGLKRATGVASSWPATWRIRPGIPIDHVLASRHWSVVASGRGPDIGSDHRPVHAALRWTRDP